MDFIGLMTMTGKLQPAKVVGSSATEPQ